MNLALFKNSYKLLQDNAPLPCGDYTYHPV